MRAAACETESVMGQVAHKIAWIQYKRITLLITDQCFISFATEAAYDCSCKMFNWINGSFLAQTHYLLYQLVKGPLRPRVKVMCVTLHTTLALYLFSQFLLLTGILHFIICSAFFILTKTALAMTVLTPVHLWLRVFYISV